MNEYPWGFVAAFGAVVLLAAPVLLLPRNLTWRQVRRPFRFVVGIVIYLVLYPLALVCGMVLAFIMMAWEKSK